MSWQDDLRELDQALAQGHVSADEYRKRRDKLLATAAGNPAPSPQPAQPAQPVQPEPQVQPAPPEAQQPAQQQQPEAQQSPSGPFAPPFRWETTPDSTQVVTNTDNPDRTQVVSQQPNQFGQQQQQHSPESDRTQTLRPLGGQPNQSQPAPPWQAQQPNAAPPWGMDDSPVMMPNPTWLSHGPEVFEPTSAGKSRSKVPWIVAAVVVVLGLGAGAFFLFGNKGGGTDPTPTVQTQAAPTTTVRPKDDLEVAQLEGKAEDVSSVRTFADAEAKGFLTPDEVKLYKAGDPGKTRMIAVTMDSGVKVYIFTAELASAANASTATTALSQQQIAYGMKQFSGVSQGVLAANIEKAGDVPATIRAHYVHKATVTRIQVHGDDMAQVTTVFNNVLEQQLEALAPTG
jgi:hypothetical protein